ncbi:fungal-specific transcription factor domain-containing protein [Aspergillus ambiguus]|uniref:putative C6 transcription factor n=1 Tax=Aspergillus ambiguus TaxID=176160 RepID=UPI003CCD364D
MSSHPSQASQSINPVPGDSPSTSTSHSTSHGAQDSSSHRSCVTCRRRKVRCNKRCPCSNCARAGIECVYPPPGRAPRKTKRPQDAELLARLRRLEGVIEHLSEQNATSARQPSPEQQNVNIPATATTTTNEPSQFAPPPAEESAGCPFNLDPKKPLQPRNLQHEFGRLVIDEGRSRYVSNRFWASLGDEIEELQDILDPSSSEDEDYPSPESNSNSAHSANHDGFLFGFYSLSHSLRSFHPPSAKIPLLWNVYLENVAPLVPIVHKPSAQQLFANAAKSVEMLDKNSEALLLAMSFVSIVSLTPEQCLSLLGEERDAAVGRYRFAVEQALSKANFLNTQNLILLQAAVIFLIGVRREDDTKFVWAMTALVLRLAQGLGLHRDGTNFGLKPFETEMRRRLWWHICLLDIRSSEDHGTEFQIHERIYDTRLPLNVNDEDLTPDMQEPPQERVGFTDMTFCLIRCDITVALRRVGSGCPNKNVPGPREPSPEHCGQLIQMINHRIEERYLKYCDNTVPIQWVCATIGRLILTKLWLVVHHPMTRPYEGLNLTNASRESLFKTSVEVAEFAQLLTTEKNTQKWNWLFATNMQWHSIAFILSELCVRPLSPLTDRAWNAVSSLYEDWIQTSKQRKGMLWRPLARLMKRAAAFRAKQKETQNQLGTASACDDPTLFSLSDKPGITVPPPILPQFPPPPMSSDTASRGVVSTPPGSRLDMDFDIRQGPMDLFQELFPNVDWLSVQTSQGAPGSQMATNQPPTTDINTSDVVADGLMAPAESQQDPAMQLSWNEWDQVMRDFHTDVQEAQSAYPMNNMNVFDWLP